ncbi:MAG: sigma-54 dependent transcriptional regulator [Oricola sp.]
MNKGHVFLIDDDTDLLGSATDWLEVNGFLVSAFSNAADAISALVDEAPDLVISDIRMPGIDGMVLLATVKNRHPEIPVILLTAHGEVSVAVNAIKSGAEDFLEKPYDADHLIAVLENALKRRAVVRELGRLQRIVQQQTGAFDEILGNDPRIVQMKQRLAALAPLDVDVLIIGETGTGKELVARSLHEMSARAGHPFTAINCAAIPDDLFESELFGHAKGAFTGADRERIGKFEHADGGTVFLDEVESMPLLMQAKMLRVLQERIVERIGENRQRPIDIRIVTAAKTDPSDLVASGKLREDLYYRLGAASLPIPPLRERNGDIVLLYAHFAALARRRYGLPDVPVSHALERELRGHTWPGNVRELKARADRDALGINWTSDFEQPRRGTAHDLSTDLREFEMSKICEALEAVGGDVKRAAERLGIPRRTLSDKISRYSRK